MSTPAGPVDPAAPDADRLPLLGPEQREAATDVIRVLLTALEAD